MIMSHVLHIVLATKISIKIHAEIILCHVILIKSSNNTNILSVTTTAGVYNTQHRVGQYDIILLVVTCHPILIVARMLCPINELVE